MTTDVDKEQAKKERAPIEMMGGKPPEPGKAKTEKNQGTGNSSPSEMAKANDCFREGNKSPESPQT